MVFEALAVFSKLTNRDCRSCVQRYEVEDDELTPEEVANRHLGSAFRDSGSVLKGARHMVRLLLM